jgi:hypothetical protein
MSKKNKQVNELLLGGKSVSASLLRGHREQRKRSVLEQAKAKEALRRESGKYLSALEKSMASGAGESEEAARAAAGLRSFSERLAKRKIAAPAVQPVPSRILAAQYVVNIGTPFTDGYYYPLGYEGETNVSASADAQTGQLEVSAGTVYQGPGYALPWAELEIVYRPPFPIGLGTLSVSANPSLSFAWSVNAMHDPNGATSAAELMLLVQSVDINDNLTGESYDVKVLWDRTLTNGLAFDLGSMTVPLSTQLDIVAGDRCIIWMYCQCIARGAGWPPPPPKGKPVPPRSMASSEVALTLPSVTLDLQWQYPIGG